MKSSPQVNSNGFHYKSEVKEMDFGSAMAEVMKGKKARRLSWEDKGVYLSMKDEKLMIFKTDDKVLHPLIVTTGDIEGIDWEVVKEDRAIH